MMAISSNPLTDADLAAIEARHTTTLDNGERVIDEDTAHLLAAVREARALVEALFKHGEFSYQGEHYNQLGYGTHFSCFVCEREAKIEEFKHAPDCAWEAAREAVEAWGGGDE